MLVYSNYPTPFHVKFISYDGRYPNLCNGVLILEIDGIKYKFGHHYSNYHYNEITKQWYYTDEDTDNPNFDKFWESGGSCGFTNNYEDSYVNQGEWKINVEDIPEQFRKYAAEIDEEFNSSVPYGCCGGCI